MNQILPILGQFITIAALTGTLCFVVKEMNKMPYTFYYIYVNRMRYFKIIGFKETFKTIFFHYEPEYHPVNESYRWLSENKLYKSYAIYFAATLITIFGLLHQLGNGQVYTKPKEFFFSSPLRSLSILYIFIFLVGEVNYWRKEATMAKKKAIDIAQKYVDEHVNK